MAWLHGAMQDCIAEFCGVFPGRDGGASGESRWEAAYPLFAASPEFEMPWHHSSTTVGTIGEPAENVCPSARLGQFSLQQMYWYSAPRNSPTAGLFAGR